MPAPLLRALDPQHPNVARAPGCLPALPAGEVRAFLVVGEGSFGGTDFSVGDVIVCRGAVRSGGTTVLEARHGRPRMGSLLGQRLVGDAGEACHPGRWRPVGALWAVYRRDAVAGGAWRAISLSPVEEPSTASPEPVVAMSMGRVVLRGARAVRAARPGQLALFAA
jgi:hypothetical protein